ncbi:CheR family methyltransferase [Aurantiacibacter gangjinensis]|uniref:CheR family methyltransferase n=1 Tax=Aurantiacibacter gangjinensis TaxID=502682 RepID=UPI00069C8CAC|nr:protein-glutamate O-methyltransferase CheR [Aurantiacibacter gangjinensis]
MVTESERFIAKLLESRTGQELTQGRSWRIGTALSGIFREKGISNIDQLVCLLDAPDHAILSQQVVEALLNNETYFFRDRAMFDQLATKVLPRIAERKAIAKSISILCAGCSTGQEALSLAMLFQDQRSRWADWTISIDGVDVSQSAINSARSAVYSQFEVQRGLSVAQMLAHFTETPTGWEANDALRQMTQFRVHNLLEPLGGSAQYDLILCRNVLLYFDEPTRQKVLGRLVERLDPAGWLMLGAGETIADKASPLKSVRNGINLYRRTDTDLRA